MCGYPALSTADNPMSLFATAANQKISHRLNLDKDMKQKKVCTNQPSLALE